MEEKLIIVIIAVSAILFARIAMILVNYLIYTAILKKNRKNNRWWLL